MQPAISMEWTLGLIWLTLLWIAWDVTALRKMLAFEIGRRRMEKQERKVAD